MIRLDVRQGKVFVDAVEMTGISYTELSFDPTGRRLRIDRFLVDGPEHIKSDFGAPWEQHIVLIDDEFEIT
jgi:hypothetical protein